MQQTTDDSILKNSLLLKESKKWKEYYFVLGRDSNLYWFKSVKDSSKVKNKKGAINLHDATITSPIPQEPQPYSFQIKASDNNLHLLAASSDGEADKWIRTIRAVIESKGDVNRLTIMIEVDLSKTGYVIAPEELEFRDEEVIGSGASGIVKRGLWLKSTEVAVKALKNLPEFTDQKELTAFYKEIETLSKLRHTNIVQMYGFCKKSNFICLVTEFVRGGNLQSALSNPSKYPVDLKQQFELALSIARGMVYLHSVNVVHRDLKPANILIESWEDARMKVCDFGLSKVVKKQDAQMTASALGSPQYAAPELNTETHTNKVDVFSFAIILWEIVTHEQPWPELKFGWQFAEKYTKGERPTLPNSPFSPIIQKCWAQDPNDRPTFVQVYEELEALKRAHFGGPPTPVSRSSPMSGQTLRNPMTTSTMSSNESFYMTGTSTVPTGRPLPPPPKPVTESFYMTGSQNPAPKPPVQQESFYMTGTAATMSGTSVPPPVRPLPHPHTGTMSHMNAKPPVQQESFYMTGTANNMNRPFVPPRPPPPPANGQQESFYMSPGQPPYNPHLPNTAPNTAPSESFYMSPGQAPPTPTGYLGSNAMEQLKNKNQLHGTTSTGSSDSNYVSANSLQQMNLNLSNNSLHSSAGSVDMYPSPATPKANLANPANGTIRGTVTVSMATKLPSNGIDEKFAKAFGTRQKETWVVLSNLLKQTMNASPKHLAAIKYLFDDGGNVDKAIWDHFLLWFSPLAGSRSQEGYDIDTIVNIVEPSWFHGFLSSADAQQKIKGFADGTFLVRFSTANAGYYALSVAYCGMVGHWRIQSIKEPGKPMKYIFDEREFPSLKDIVDTYSAHGKREPLKIKQPKPDQPPTILLTEPFHRAEQYYQNIHN